MPYRMPPMLDSSLLRRYGVFLLVLCCCLGFVVGCDASSRVTEAGKEQDWAGAEEALRTHNWSLAERTLERYLRQEDDADKRWQAWNNLLHASKRGGASARALLDTLETMLVEYGEDAQRAPEVLRHMGELYENTRRYDRAAEVWSTYLDQGTVSAQDLMHASRRLAHLHFSAQRFDAGEDVLQGCLALVGPEAEKAYCLYDLADMYAAREMWKESIDVGTQVLDLDVAAELRGLTLFLLGDAWEQLKKPAEALQYFEEAQGLYPNEHVVDNRITYLKNNPKK